MTDKFIVDDFSQVLDTIFRNDLIIFELLYGESYESDNHEFDSKCAYRRIYHMIENTIDVMHIEGIEIEYIDTNFGLKEMIVRKIK